jgi:hypothetical protein
MFVRPVIRLLRQLRRVAFFESGSFLSICMRRIAGRMVWRHTTAGFDAFIDVAHYCFERIVCVVLLSRCSCSHYVNFVTKLQFTSRHIRTTSKRQA